MSVTEPITLSRRALFLGTLSLAALSSATPALATDLEVQTAIATDFGALTVPPGEMEIDLPEFSDSGKSVPLTVRIPCTMTGLDYPDKVSVYAARNPRPRIISVSFTPDCAVAEFSTRIRIESYQDITIVARMADGRIFKAVRKVDVTYGACEEAVANDQFPPGWAPSIRVSVPPKAQAGQAVPVRTLISHPMETGLRHNNRGLLIPVRITEDFQCRSGDKLLISAKMEPAVAANPYLAFQLRAGTSTRLDFSWTDTTGDIYSATADLVVA